MTQIAPSIREIEHADLTIGYAADVDQFEVPCAYGLDRLRIISPAFGRSRRYATDSDRGRLAALEAATTNGKTK